VKLSERRGKEHGTSGQVMCGHAQVSTSLSEITGCDFKIRCSGREEGSDVKKAAKRGDPAEMGDHLDSHRFSSEHRVIR
jgi:hypothetical protein